MDRTPRIRSPGAAQRGAARSGVRARPLSSERVPPAGRELKPRRRPRAIAVPISPAPGAARGAARGPESRSGTGLGQGTALAPELAPDEAGAGQSAVMLGTPAISLAVNPDGHAAAAEAASSRKHSRWEAVGDVLLSSGAEAGVEAGAVAAPGVPAGQGSLFEPIPTPNLPGLLDPEHTIGLVPDERSRAGLLEEFAVKAEARSPVEMGQVDVSAPEATARLPPPPPLPLLRQTLGQAAAESMRVERGFAIGPGSPPPPPLPAVKLLAKSEGSTEGMDAALRRGAQVHAAALKHEVLGDAHTVGPASPDVKSPASAAAAAAAALDQEVLDFARAAGPDRSEAMVRETAFQRVASACRCRAPAQRAGARPWTTLLPCGQNP